MISRPREDDWDLTPVIDLIYSLSIGEEACTKVRSIPSPPNGLQEEYGTIAIANGFNQESQLGNFDKIWQHLGQPLNLLPPIASPESESTSDECFEANGATEQLNPKEVRWRDEVERADIADVDDNHDPYDLSGLTKAQRRKARRKQRRTELAQALPCGRATSSDSEDSPIKDVAALQSPNRQAVINEILHGTTTSETATGRLRSGKSFRSDVLSDNGIMAVASSPSTNKAIQVLKPQKENHFAATTAKKARLIAMLIQGFVDERQYLNNISPLQQADPDADVMGKGVHVFVDASNIMIGFHDALKMSRGQSINHRMRRQPLSFHNFSLILERGRPTTKRVVVGSDNFPAIAEAKAIGYETCILDRVHKAKELTARQKRFSYPNGNGTGTGSGSETTAAIAVQHAPEKWVEQAVDEILHLKMMESIVDASEPSTMVLATGDAAEAEYSGGFLKMVERALSKGWKIELASFRHNTSFAYRKKEFRQKWGDRFKVVELDKFVEMLLGVE